jgi:hypothetical protein
MTGQPADTGVKCRFITVPRWAYLSLLLVVTGIGLLPIAIILRVLSRAESGRLPYHSSIAGRVRLWRGLSIGTFVAIPFLLVASIAAINGDQVVDGVLWGGLAAAILAALVLRYVVLQRFLPKGFVHPSRQMPGRWVELRRVHPSFAGAVNEMYAARNRAYALSQGLPES